jgi:hypothetical protein
MYVYNFNTRVFDLARASTKGLKGWPVEYVTAMNKTKPVLEDLEFMKQVRLMVREQEEAFGGIHSLHIYIYIY